MPAAPLGCALLCALVLPLSIAQAQINYSLTTSNCPVCTKAQVDAWRFVTLEMQGIRGIDPNGAQIGRFEAGRTFHPPPLLTFIPTWKPLSFQKQSLCGTLDRFQIFDGGFLIWGEVDEFDWNNFIIPSPAFRQMLDWPKWLMDDPAEVHDCAGGVDNCMEAEITPDEGLYDNPFFGRAQDEGPCRGPLNSMHCSQMLQPVCNFVRTRCEEMEAKGRYATRKGKSLCVYGPYVGDLKHGGRPEIHPSELLWWSDSNPAGSQKVYHMMLVQDDSNRFDRPGFFGLPGASFPANWRPWAKFPRRGEFQIAFDVDPARDRVDVLISEFDALRAHVVTAADAAARVDSDDGSDHALEYNGQVLVKALELQPADDDIGVRFQEICRRADGTLQGYLSLSSAIGEGDRGGEGYHTLFATALRRKVTTTSSLPPITAGAIRPVKGQRIRVAAAPRPATPRLFVQPGTLRSVVVNGRRQLLADAVTAQAFSATGVSDASSAAVLSDSGPARSLEVVARRRVVGIPLSPEGGAVLQLREPDGEHHLSLPDVALDLRVHRLRPSAPAAADGAWRTVAKWGSFDSASKPSSPLRAAREWRLDLDASYRPMRDGKVAGEENPGLAKELNAVMSRQDPGELAKLFGSARPISAAWSFEVVDLQSNRRVPVVTSRPARPGEASVSIAPAGLTRHELSVVFPLAGEGEIYECRVTGTLRDTHGLTGRMETRFWSHYFPPGSLRPYRPTVTADAAGAGTVAAAVIAAAEYDSVITLGEFRRLVYGLRQVSTSTSQGTRPRP